jgi:hypothetical protein
MEIFWIMIFADNENPLSHRTHNLALNPFTASCENAVSLSVPGVPAPVVASHSQFGFNPFTASCENAMSLSVPGVPAPHCEKFPHSSHLKFE